MYAKCTVCKYDWNVSIKQNINNYVCPECTKRKNHPKKATKEHKDLIRSVLLKNKSKFGGI